MEQKEDYESIDENNSSVETVVGDDKEQVMDLPPYIPLECFESAMRSNMEADRFILNTSFEITACDGIEGERLSENITISTCLLNSILKEYSNYYDEIADMIWFAWLRGSRPLSSERLRIIFSDLEAQQHKIIRSAQAFNTDPPLSIRNDLVIPVVHGEVEYLELETESLVTEFDPIYSHTNEIVRETIVRPLPSDLTPYHAVFASRNITPQSVIQLIESRFRLLPVNEQTEGNRSRLLSQYYEEIVARESLQLRIDLAERIAVHERRIEYETSGKAQRHQEELEISNIWSLVPQWRRQEREEKRFNSHWQDLSILEKKTEMNLVLAFKELKQALLDLNAYNDKQNSKNSLINNSNHYTAVSSNNNTNNNNNSDNNSDSESNSPPLSPLKTLENSPNSSKSSLKLSHIIDNKVDNFLINMRNFIYIQPHLQYAWEFVLKYLKILSEIAIENKTIIKLNEIAHNEMKLSPIRIKEMKTEYYLNESYHSFPTSTSLCKLFQTGAYDEAFSEYDLPVYYAHCAMTMWNNIVTQYSKIMNKEQDYAIAWASIVQQAHYHRDYAIAMLNVGLAGQSYTKTHRLFSKYSQISVLNNTTEFDLIAAYHPYITSAHSTVHLIHIARDCVNKSIEHFTDTNNTIVFDRLMSLLSTLEEQRTFIVDNLYWCQGKLLTIILKQTPIPACDEFNNIINNINNTDFRNHSSVSDTNALQKIMQQWDIVFENTNNVYKLYRSFSDYLVENELFCLRSVERHVSWLDCKLKATQNLNKHILLLALFIAQKATYRYKYNHLTQLLQRTGSGNDISSNSCKNIDSSGLYGINVPQNVRSIFGINDNNNNNNNNDNISSGSINSNRTSDSNDNISSNNSSNNNGSSESAEVCLTEWRCVLSTAIDLFRDDSERYNRHILKLNKVIEKFNMPSDKHALTAHDIEHIIKKNNFIEKEQWWLNMVEMIKYLKLQAENQLLFDEYITIAGDKTNFFLSIANQTMTTYESSKNNNSNSGDENEKIHNNCVDLLADIEQIISHGHKLINSSIQNIVTTSLDLKKLTKYRKKVAYFTGCVVYKSFDLEDWFASVNHTNHMKNIVISLDTSKRALLRVNALVCSEIATKAAEFENIEDGDFNTYSADIAVAHNAATTALHAWERLQYHERELGLDCSISDRQIEMWNTAVAQWNVQLQSGVAID